MVGSWALITSTNIVKSSGEEGYNVRTAKAAILAFRNKCSVQVMRFE